MIETTLIPQEVEDAAERVGSVIDGYGKTPDAILETDTPGAVGFTVGDESRANWVLAKVAEIQGELARAEQTAKDEIERAQLWIESRRRVAKRQVDWFGMALEGFARARFAETGGKLKTIKLPHGQLALRDEPDKWDWFDEDVLRCYLEDGGLRDMIDYKPQLRRQTIKGETRVTETGEVALRSTGEVLPGVRVVPEPGPKFSFKAE